MSSSLLQHLSDLNKRRLNSQSLEERDECFYLLSHDLIEAFPEIEKELLDSRALVICKRPTDPKSTHLPDRPNIENIQKISEKSALYLSGEIKGKQLLDSSINHIKYLSEKTNLYKEQFIRVDDINTANFLAALVNSWPSIYAELKAGRKLVKKLKEMGIPNLPTSKDVLRQVRQDEAAGWNASNKR